MKIPTFRQSMYWLCVLLSGLGPFLGYGWEAFAAASMVLLVMYDPSKQQPPSFGAVASITGRYSGPSGDEVDLEIPDPSPEELGIYLDAARYRRLREAHPDDKQAAGTLYGEELDAAMDQELAAAVEAREGEG